MLKLRYIAAVAAVVCLASCSSPKELTPAENLKRQITSYVEQGQIMFGHQDDYMYGHSWKLEPDAAEYNRSDVHATCGKYPAVYGMDLGGIEMDWEANLDRNLFSHMRAAAVAHYERGGVITFSWHPRNPLTGGDAWDVTSDQVVASILPGGEKHEYFVTWLSKAADFLESIKTADGTLVPVIWRPWHEHTGSWFWWGQNLCTTEQYKALWRFTYDYMVNQRGLANLLWAYSPGAGGLDAELFEERYPGDEIVDMVGFDCYQYGDNASYMREMKNALEVTKTFAQEHGKLMAVTETGYEGIKDENWWTDVFYQSFKDYPVSYVLVWRNACDADMQHHFYAPYPEHTSAADFKVFSNLPAIKFL